MIKKQRNNDIEIIVLFLDETKKAFQVSKNARGSDVLDLVLDYLQIKEKCYFGLQVLTVTNDSLIIWLDAQKSVPKQVSTGRQLQFRVKFFPVDPDRILDEKSQIQFFLQAKKDTESGTLPCSISTRCLLASYVVQAELGDFDSLEHKHGYLRNLKLIDNFTDDMENRISEHHKLHKGQSPIDARYSYLECVSKLPLYGVYIFKSVDITGRAIQLGVSSLGISVYHNLIQFNTFSWAKMLQISLKNKQIFIHLKREQSEDYNTIVGFGMLSRRNAKLTWKLCVEHHAFFRLKYASGIFVRCNPFVKSSTFHYTGETEIEFNQKYKEITSVATKAIDGSPLSVFSKSSDSKKFNEKSGNGKLSILAMAKSYKSYDNKVTSKPLETMPRKAWEHQSDDAYPLTHHLQDNGERKNNIKEYENDLTTVHLIADEQGYFGFNLRGGIDYNLPISISRIFPHTPADRVTPKISEGDQVLYINGQDVSGLKNHEVVNLIKCAIYTHGARQLVLTIRRYSKLIISRDEPLFQYVPDNKFVQSRYDTAAFFQSILLLNDSVASGALLEQYEQLYRKNPYLSITEALKPENLTKNRYKDILPYDFNRVIIIDSPNGNYVNANYVNMDIPKNTVNRYIATQGPLESTVLEFWRMVQQESSSLIVMLTTLVECGMIKCHKYWPELHQKFQLTPTFSVELIKEEVDNKHEFVTRDLQLVDSSTGEQRAVRHLQYLNWSDHNLPEERGLFFTFVEKMRETRAQNLAQSLNIGFSQLNIPDVDASDTSPEEVVLSDSGSKTEKYEKIPTVSTSLHQFISAANPPVIVHCSAGVGRTGMIILMDTALSLIHSKEPIYPLDILKKMRDQRVCMVQNAAQYKFICECICAAYAEIANKETE